MDYSKYNKIKSLLDNQILFLDGAMGTCLQKYNFSEADFRGSLFKNHTHELLGNNDVLSLTNPSAILEIHKSYLEAGANIIETNSFGANATVQKEYGLETHVVDMNFKAAALAKVACNQYREKNPDVNLFVAGVLGPTSKTLSLPEDVNDFSFRSLSFDELSENYYNCAKALISGGADLILIETIFDTLNAKAAIYAILKLEEQLQLRIPTLISLTISDNSGRTLSGQTLQAFLTSVQHANPISVGLNCSTGPADMEPYLNILSDTASCYVSLHPNAGLPNEEGKYCLEPEAMAQTLSTMALSGKLNLVGGCCGTTPSHIKEIVSKLRGIAPRKLPQAESKTNLSGLENLVIDSTSGFVKVGERTNVSGSAKFKRLICEENFSEAIAIAKEQVENGAAIIDINMDDPLIDGEKSMVKFLRLLSSEVEVSKVPFMIDSSDFNIVTSALKTLQGRAIVNSISLKEGEEQFLKKAKEIYKLGASVLVMAFDEKGQADNYERKIEICERSFKLLTEEVGFNECDIIFDCNVFAIGTGMEEHNNYAVDFIEAVRTLKKSHPNSLTSAGLSNVSFAFRGNNPLRSAIHAVFLQEAISAGLTMAIANPTTNFETNALPSDLKVLVEDLVLNKNAEATAKILEAAERFKNASDSTVSSNETKKKEWELLEPKLRVAKALVVGESKFLFADIDELKKGLEPLQIIEGPLMAGMEEVGSLFGEGKMFLPSVIKSASVMKLAVDYLEPDLKREKKSSRGKILIATVKGDVHDIGKNILSVVLQCNSFEVIDLGVMVEGTKIVAEALANKVDLICLSGLITPSLTEMENVLKLLEEKKIDIPVMVGGATTSQRHTDLKLQPIYSGIVGYTKDASSAVIKISSILRGEIAKPTKKSESPKAVKSSLLSRASAFIKNLPINKKNEKIFYNLSQARKHKIKFSYAPVVPNVLGVNRWTPSSLQTLIDLIDWDIFVSEWGMGKKHQDEHFYGEEREKLIDDAKEILEIWKQEEKLLDSDCPKLCGLYGIFPATKNEEDELLVFAPGKKYSEPIAVIPFLRSQEPNKNGHTISLVDYIAPPLKSNGKIVPADYVGFFAITIGVEIEMILRPYQKKGDAYKETMIKILANRLVEAASNLLFDDVRKTHWGFDPSCQSGINPAVGYPISPDLEILEKIFSLMSVQARTGIGLTSSMMMLPEASICGVYLAHKESHFFGIGKIDEEQLTDYAARLKKEASTVRPFLRGHLIEKEQN